MNFEQAALLFKLNYRCPKTKQELTNAYKQSLTSTTSTLIEVVTNRKQNVNNQELLKKKILSTLN